MPDIRNEPLLGGANNNIRVGDNYRRAASGFSRFGTRRLAFYTIWIYNIDQATLDQLMNSTETDRSYPWEYLEPAGSILEAIQRGVQLIAEPYAWGEWDFNSGDYSNHYDLYMTFVVAADTVLDGYGQDHQNPVPANPNAYNFEQAISDAIGDSFNYSGMYVQRAILVGDYIQEVGGDAIARNAISGKTSAKKAEIEAAGKSLFKRN